jgi:hypothetical protein
MPKSSEDLATKEAGGGCCTGEYPHNPAGLKVCLLKSRVMQVVGQRVFKGHAFVTRPSVIDFQDFLIGRAYRKKLIITNVSLTFNRFKVVMVAYTAGQPES